MNRGPKSPPPKTRIFHTKTNFSQGKSVFFYFFLWGLGNGLGSAAAGRRRASGGRREIFLGIWGLPLFFLYKIRGTPIFY